MSEQNTFVASDETVGRNHKPNRKEPKQISFRVSESEYLKLMQSAETLNMSVPAFVKKKAQGSRLVAPKFDKETRQSIARDLSKLGANANQIARDLSKLGANANQIAKYCNQHQYDAPNYPALERNISELRERLDEIWQQLN
ncbi:MobC family plasmid mobilization relaxosome protein [Staphylococcus epidermidis]|nr:MobC family plasmid mobilization relaxosome protein [Staphylococcus epidermidis]